MQNYFLSLTEKVPSTGKYFTMITMAASPLGEGNVTINSKSPFDPPLFDLGLLGAYWDVATMREAVKSTAIIANSSALSGFIGAPHGALAGALADGSDAAIEEYVREQSVSIFHASCSTRMTSGTTADGVLDASLKVLGATGLRVVDAGAFVRRFVVVLRPERG
jgi:choline dehydrogenase-like flavoprotein